jgi:hypothetical protein
VWSPCRTTPRLLPLHARLKVIVKKAEDAEAQATAACRHVQAARLLDEESKAATLEQMATAARQRVPSSSSSSSSTYEDTVVAGFHL